MDSKDLLILTALIYLLIMLAIGFWANRKVKNYSDFMVAGRQLPYWLCTFTLFATWFGGGTCIGAAGAAYEGGMLGVIADPFGAALCLALAGLFYVRKLRRLAFHTVADFFKARFGKEAELLCSIFSIPAYVGWVGSQFVAIGFIFHTFTGVDVETAIFIGALCILVYTTIGGLWAVAVTDFIQALVIIVGLLVLFALVLTDLGGVEQALSLVPTDRWRLIPDSSFKDWLWYLQAWFVVGLGNLPGQDLVQRAMGARSENVAQTSAISAGALYLLIGLVPVFLGMLGSFILPELENAELIVPLLCQKYLPPVGMAILLCALFSALMSSADSALLAAASLVGKNISAFFSQNQPQETVLKITRWAIPVLGLLALVIALYFKNVYNLMVNSWSTILVTLFVPFTAGLFWRKANRPAAVMSMLAGLVFWLVLLLVQSRYPADLLATAMAAGVMVIGSLWTGKHHPPTWIPEK